jgi:hypothetical protein
LPKKENQVKLDFVRLRNKSSKERSARKKKRSDAKQLSVKLRRRRLDSPHNALR